VVHPRQGGGQTPGGALPWGAQAFIGAAEMEVVNPGNLGCVSLSETGLRVTNSSHARGSFWVWMVRLGLADVPLSEEKLRLVEWSAQVVQHLPTKSECQSNKCEALSSNPNTTKKFF
jgi:hypothetical protein